MISISSKENLGLDFYKELYPDASSGLFIEYKVIDLDTLEEYILASNQSVINKINSLDSNNFQIYGIDKNTGNWC